MDPFVAPAASLRLVLTMFVKAYTEVVADYERITAVMQEQPGSWLGHAAADASSQGERMLVDVGLQVGPPPLERPSRVEVGELVATNRVASLPLRIVPQDPSSLIPLFVGSLDAAWLGAGRTHLALSLQYDPPFGFVGRVADRALLHRVAEATAHRFLQKVTDQLTVLLAA
ncbi:MAG: hypothetical protein J2P45_09095 [Candidatus Dormibacteraeota bacterium]|nr:hypothetical protein [Candidatus Dormibacteraeota bacterium]